MASETFTNRLAREKSPYLLQHATNPVDWYPWGDEAFEKARKEDKPIFLSIGYSTCHWCHVMEEESFTNSEIASILNANFVSIKVDREERPDVDHIYMQAVMAMTGSGGWPMSVFLTPERKPFYGGTYFPPTDRWGRPGFVTLLNTIKEKWSSERERLVKSGEEFAEYIREETRKKSSEKHPLDEHVLQSAYEQFDSRFDTERGGFGDAPKFPQSHGLSYLLRYWKRVREPNALLMVEKTLDEMAKGGMYDQLQGGFHRYSTDSEWRVPHFEKMIYDQAILSKSYLEAYQATQNENDGRIAREIFDYVLRDMTGPEGAFYSAEDADSAPDPAKPKEKKEGAFYVWTDEKITALLGQERAQIFNYYFGIEPKGNAIHDPQGELKDQNVLYVAHSLEETAKKFRKNTDEIKQILDESKKILITERVKRARPHLDDKVLTDWNGLMISSLAFGSRVLNEPRYLEAAKRSADFILTNCVIASPEGARQSLRLLRRFAPRNDEQRRLMHRFRDGEVSIKGFLEDYAFFIHGLIDLYEASFDPRYLEEAKFLADDMIRLFWDEENGGFFFTGHDAEALISRTKEIHDGAVPSGNSIAVLSLLRLSRLTMNQAFETKAKTTMEIFSTQLIQYPSGFSQMMIAVDFALGPAREIVIAGPEGDERVKEMVREIYASFIPIKVVLFHPSEGETAKKIEALSPFIENQRALNGKTTVYVCQNYICQLPVKEVYELKSLLDH